MIPGIYHKQYPDAISGHQKNLTDRFHVNDKSVGQNLPLEKTSNFRVTFVAETLMPVFMVDSFSALIL